MRLSCIVLSLLLAALCAGCIAAPAPSTAPADGRQDAPSRESAPADAQIDEEEADQAEKVLRLYIDGTELTVDWEDNDTVAALAELASPEALSVPMSMYGGFEQVGPLGASLPRSDSPMATQAGDIVLYAGSQIVVFYGPHSWSYTRLGRIADLSAAELEALLGGGDVTLTLSWSSPHGAA